MQPALAIGTEFDGQVRRLGLTREECVSSAELKNWCERNRNRVYVPEWLIAAWGITVEVTWSSAA